jgi:ferredoxin
MSTAPALWVRVDPPLCGGHRLCLQLTREVCDITDDEIAACMEHPGREHFKSIQAAVAACPRRAITVVDETGDPAKMKP